MHLIHNQGCVHYIITGPLFRNERPFHFFLVERVWCRIYTPDMEKYLLMEVFHAVE